MTDKLQRLMNAAARLVTGTHKFDHGLSRLLHDDLHWLDVPERIQYKIGFTVHRCLQSKAPKYGTLPTVAQSQRLLADAIYARPVDITCQYHVTGSLPSAVEPSPLQARQSGTLPDSLQDPALSSSNFRQLLKTDLFNRYSTHSAQ